MLPLKRKDSKNKLEENEFLTKQDLISRIEEIEGIEMESSARVLKMEDSELLNLYRMITNSSLFTLQDNPYLKKEIKSELSGMRTTLPYNASLGQVFSRYNYFRKRMLLGESEEIVSRHLKCSQRSQIEMTVKQSFEESYVALDTLYETLRRGLLKKISPN